MPNEVSNVQSEDLRLKSIRTQMQNRHANELHEIEEKNNSDVQHLTEQHTEITEKLKSAYDVQISREAEELEARLADVRAHNELRVSAEKKQGDGEVEKIKTSTQQRVDEYRKNGESQLETMRKQITATKESLHEREKTEARKARLTTPTPG